jgi:hypothetical protein
MLNRRYPHCRDEITTATYPPDTKFTLTGSISCQEEKPFQKTKTKKKCEKWFCQIISVLILTYGTRFEVLLVLAGAVA